MNHKFIGKQSYYTEEIFSLVVVMMMFGNAYLFPLFKSLDMGEVLLMLFFPYFFTKIKSSKIERKHSLIYLFVWYAVMLTLAMTAILNGSLSAPIIRMGRDFFYYFVIFFLGVHFFDLDSFKKIMINFCLILSALVILQVFVHAIFGYLIPGIFLGAMMNDGGYTGAELYANHLRYANIAGYLKPNGFLCEPAHCAQCFFVGVLTLLFDDQQQKDDVKKAIFISIGMFLTMSTSAMLYLGFAWILWSIREGKKNILKFIVMFIGVGAVILWGMNKGQFDNTLRVIGRFTDILTGSKVTNSSQLRMMKGFQTFSALPFGFKIFGIGFGNYAPAVTNLLRDVEINMLENEYMNTVAYLMMSSGILGFSMLAIFYIGAFLQSEVLSRVMIIALVMMALGSSIYSSPIWIWMMLIILYSERKAVWQMQ